MTRFSNPFRRMRRDAKGSETPIQTGKQRNAQLQSHLQPAHMLMLR